MIKRFSAWILCFLLIASCLPGSALAAADAETMKEEAVLLRNSDVETAHDGVCWYADSMNGNVLTSSRVQSSKPSCSGAFDDELVITRLTDWPVDQLLWWEGSLLVSAGDKLMKLSPDTGAVLDTIGFEAPIARFAMGEEGLYVLSGASVLLLADGQRTVKLSGGVEQFWLEDSDTLCYLRDQEMLHSIDLSTGVETLAPNLHSSLPDETAGDEIAPQVLGLSGLKSKFPHGKYWNHMPNRGTGMSYNNQNGWTNQACYKHNNYCGTAYQTCNGYAPNGKELSYQCWGFADKLGYDATGRDPQNNPSSGWTKLWYSSSLNSLKAGDIVRFNKNGSSAYAHSIYVTAVSGDTVTYADCNYNGTCIIRWGQTIARSTLKAWFVFLLKAPSALAPQPTPTPDPKYEINVNGVLDGTGAEKTDGYATFDVWINGALYKSNVTDFKESRVKGTKYEIKNIKTAARVDYNAAASSSLSGTLSANTKPLVALDHYWINSAGQHVKTKLTDLPAQSHWSYKSITWALENGIASGVSETKFAPQEECTRAQVLTFLWAALGRPDPTLTELSFEDVSPKRYYYKAVCWAVENGITAGYSPERFGPMELCNRAQVISFLWCAAGKPTPTVLADLEDPAPPREDGETPDPDQPPEDGEAPDPDQPPEDGETPDPEPQEPLSPFTDVRENAYYYKAVLWAVEKGIAAGTSQTAFSPKKICTREQVLGFLRKYVELG